MHNLVQKWMRKGTSFVTEWEPNIHWLPPDINITDWYECSESSNHMEPVTCKLELKICHYTIKADPCHEPVTNESHGIRTSKSLTAHSAVSELSALNISVPTSIDGHDYIACSVPGSCDTNRANNQIKRRDQKDKEECITSSWTDT